MRQASLQKALQSVQPPDKASGIRRRGEGGPGPRPLPQRRTGVNDVVCARAAAARLSKKERLLPPRSQRAEATLRPSRSSPNTRRRPLSHAAPHIDTMQMVLSARARCWSTRRPAIFSLPLDKLLQSGRPPSRRRPHPSLGRAHHIGAGPALDLRAHMHCATATVPETMKFTMPCWRWWWRSCLSRRRYSIQSRTNTRSSSG
jgi:hypothetical protein